MMKDFYLGHLLDKITSLIIEHDPRKSAPIFRSEPGRVFTFIVTIVILTAIARLAMFLINRANSRKKAFWKDQFGQTHINTEHGVQRLSKNGANLRWKRNWKLQRQHLEIRDVAHGIDEKYVKDRLPLILQKTNLRFADAKVENGIVYLYPYRLNEDIQLSNLKRPNKAFTATPGIFADGTAIHIPVDEQNCIGGFGKPGSGKSVLAESIRKSLLWHHKNAKTYIASPKLLIDFAQSLEQPNTIGIDTSSTDGKGVLLSCLREVQMRNRRLNEEFSRLKIRHLKDHPELGQSSEHEIVIFILDEIPSYTRKRKSGDETTQKIIDAIEDLILQGRAYGVILILLSQSAVREFSDLPLSQLHWVFSGATPTAEASRVLFGDDIGFDSSLTRGEMILRWDGNFRIKVGR